MRPKATLIIEHSHHGTKYRVDTSDVDLEVLIVDHRVEDHPREKPCLLGLEEVVITSEPPRHDPPAFAQLATR